MKSKWQIVKNSIKNDLPAIQENKMSMADVVRSVTLKMKQDMHTDHLDTTLPQLSNIHFAADEKETKDCNNNKSNKSNKPLKSALKKSQSTKDFTEMMKSEARDTMILPDTVGGGADPKPKTLRKSMSFTDLQIIAEVSKKVSYQDMWVSGKDVHAYMSICVCINL